MVVSSPGTSSGAKREPCSIDLGQMGPKVPRRARASPPDHSDGGPYGRRSIFSATVSATGPITRVKFGDLDLRDPFFESLVADYQEFPQWFSRKRDSEAWVLQEDGKLLAFLYLKPEQGALDDISPHRPAAPRLKAGTLKVDAHGTRLGERFIKLILDEALRLAVEEVYVTVFPKHDVLVDLLVRWGFEKAGIKATDNGVEDVYLRKMAWTGRGIHKDYPFIQIHGVRKHLLSILPRFHTRLFPDSKLNTESGDVLANVAHTNSILKIYISWSEAAKALRPGDVVVIYRMKDENRPSAWYSSVATSVCVVDKVVPSREFTSEADFVRRCSAYSVFSEEELREFWRGKRHRLTAIRMTYNFALPKRPNRKALIEQARLDGKERWTLLPLTDPQFETILALGHADERLAIDQARVRREDPER